MQRTGWHPFLAHNHGCNERNASLSGWTPYDDFEQVEVECYANGEDRRQMVRKANFRAGDTVYHSKLDLGKGKVRYVLP